MAPLSGEERSKAKRSEDAHRRVHKQRRQSQPPRRSSSRPQQHVHFSDEPEWHSQVDTYYPTPAAARPVLPTSSTRRFTIDEVELYFSEDLSRRPVSERDYAVHRIKGRDEFLMCGVVEYRKVHVGIPRWRTCWAELYHGVVILRKWREKSVDKKRKLVPVAKCELELLDVTDHFSLEIKHLFQGQPKRCVLRFATKSDLFMWWWAIQLAAMSPVDGRVLHKSMSRPALSPFFFLASAESSLETVFFPRAMRRQRSGSYPQSSSEESQNSSSNNVPDRSYGVVHLIFVRHGETENIHFRVCDREKTLTSRGIEQAEQTASFLSAQLKADRAANEHNTTLIYGGLRRTVETAAKVEAAMPWLKHKYECSFLEEGAPKSVAIEHRQEYRDAMHKMAFEYICRWGGDNTREFQRRRGGGRPAPVTRPPSETFKIIVCHASFVQFCVAQCYGVAKEVIQLGAPIAHCSLTQVDVMKGDLMEAECTNRVTHLPLTHRTSD